VKSETLGKSVLLIEDNPGDARLIREMLAEDSTQPFELAHATRLSTGIEQLSRKAVDLVLLDLSLPDSQGIETFSKIYAHSPKVPIIVLSGNDDQQLALYAVKSGAVVNGSNADPIQFEEYWTFSRPVGPNAWKLSAVQQA
jgi:DNA-binding NarL/FixJ family response regulator